jgi:lysophospholipid acyltransferase (LPLAT)-like uncharacterized protein
MSGSPADELTGRVARKKKPAAGPLKLVWQKVRKPLAESTLAKVAVATLLARGLRFVQTANKSAPGSDSVAESYKRITPAILTMWHGQHLMAPVVYPRGQPLTAMVSRSADAELNALVVERLGFQAIRGSGGRVSKKRQKLDKGGAKALIALKKALDAGSNVCMIADIPHGTPRQAGMGIVTLARISGKPIVPTAIATSRRRVLEKTWDKTTINLPFGRLGLIVGTPVYVPADADDAEMERKRQEITASINEATDRVYRIVDGRA